MIMFLSWKVKEVAYKVIYKNILSKCYTHTHTHIVHFNKRLFFPFPKPTDFSFFFFFNFFKFYFIFKLYKIVLVLPNIEMNPPQVYMCSPSWTLLPPPSPFHPSGSSQCTSPKHPVSCIKPGLATRFTHDIIHVSMPFSQIFPPSPSPTESIGLFYTSVCLLLSRRDSFCMILRKRGGVSFCCF